MQRASAKVLSLQIIRAIKLPSKKRKDDRKEKPKGSWPRTHIIHSVTYELLENGKKKKKQQQQKRRNKRAAESP